MAKKGKQTQNKRTVPTETPAHSVRVNQKKRFLAVWVRLHHVPPQFINVDATATHFRLNTEGYSKNYVLDVEYPDGVHCQIKDDLEASFEGGMLKCFLPLADAKTEAKARSKKAAPVQPAEAETTKKGKSPKSASKKDKKAKVMVEGSSAAMDIASEIVAENEQKMDVVVKSMKKKAQKIEATEAKREERRKRKREVHEMAMKQLEDAATGKEAKAQSGKKKSAKKSPDDKHARVHFEDQEEFERELEASKIPEDPPKKKKKKGPRVHFADDDNAQETPKKKGKKSKPTNADEGTPKKSKKAKKSKA